jgi:hypothetical protein
LLELPQAPFGFLTLIQVLDGPERYRRIQFPAMCTLQDFPQRCLSFDKWFVTEVLTIDVSKSKGSATFTRYGERVASSPGASHSHKKGSQSQKSNHDVSHQSFPADPS